jgi:hypothetical protein
MGKRRREKYLRGHKALAPEPDPSPLVVVAVSARVGMLVLSPVFFLAGIASGRWQLWSISRFERGRDWGVVSSYERVSYCNGETQKPNSLLTTVN